MSLECPVYQEYETWARSIGLAERMLDYFAHVATCPKCSEMLKESRDSVALQMLMLSDEDFEKIREEAIKWLKED